MRRGLFETGILLASGSPWRRPDLLALSQDTKLLSQDNKLLFHSALLSPQLPHKLECLGGRMKQFS